MSTGSQTEVHVIDMLRNGVTLLEIEDFIERQPISEEERSVLWLRAWSTRPKNAAALNASRRTR
jgi:hypothetical protein